MREKWRERIAESRDVLKNNRIGARNVANYSLPEFALSSDKSLTSPNIPWIFSSLFRAQSSRGGSKRPRCGTA